MIKKRLFFSVILQIIIQQIVKTDILKGLKAHYPLNGTLSDITNQNNNITNKGASLTENRSGKMLSAYHLVENNDVLIVPSDILHDLKDFSISIWVKAEVLTKEESCLISLANKYSEFFNLFAVFHSQIWLSSSKTDWEFKKILFPKKLYSGEWQHIVITRHSESNLIQIFSDGKLFYSHNNKDVEDQKKMIVEGFVIGNEQNEKIHEGFYPQYQFHGGINDLRIYDRRLKLREVRELYQFENGYVEKRKCIVNLLELKPETIMVKMQFLFEEATGNFYHFYKVKFFDFNFTKSCYDAEVWIGSKSHQFFDVDNNELFIEFKYRDAVYNGCRQITDKQQQCQFQILIYFEGILQHKRMFTSILNTPNPKKLKRNVTFKIRYDEYEELKNFDQKLESQIRFCTDIKCNSYLNQIEFERNTDMYVEFKVLTKGYDKYFLVHKFLKLNGYDVKIINMRKIRYWIEQGRIVYHIRPPFVGDFITLSIGLRLQKHFVNSRRNLGKKHKKLEGESVQSLEKWKDDVGNYIEIRIVDTLEDKGEYFKKRGWEHNLYFIFGCAVLVVLFVLAQAIIYAYYKVHMNKTARRGSGVTNFSSQQTLQDSSTPRKTIRNVSSPQRRIVRQDSTVRSLVNKEQNPPTSSRTNSDINFMIKK